MKTKNYETVLITEDRHFNGAHNMSKETKVKVKVNLNVGHHGEVPDDVADDLIVKLWKIASHRGNQTEAVDHNYDSLQPTITTKHSTLSW